MAVMEDLSEEEAYLYAILSDTSGLDQAEFSWTDMENDDMCFRAWPYQWSWWRNSHPQQIDQCFPEDALVLTRSGHKPIRDVEIGEQVWTHMGRWREVTYKWDRGIKETVVVKGYGHYGLELTPDHPVFTTDGKVEASSLVGNRWLIPKVLHDSISLPNIERVYKSGQSNIPELNDGFLWLSGLYLAEGSTSSTYGKGGKVNRITWSVHRDEFEAVASRLDAVGVNWNFDRPSENCVNFRVICEPWAQIFLNQFGKGAKNKKIPGWVFGLPAGRKKVFMDGMLFGDGYNRSGDRWEYSTISKTLAFDLKILANSLEWSASVNIAREAGEMEIEGRTVNTSVKYSVCVQPLNSQRAPRLKIEETGYSAKVQSVIPGSNKRCFDLEVDEDHSFCVEGVVVSNCGRSVGKSLSIKVRAFAFPFIHSGAEMVITAPEGVHLDAVTDVIETSFYNTRLGREMLVKGRSGVKHRPFHMNFANGSRIMGRIPQRDGKGVKGTHPIWLEMDEAQDYPDKGWVEIIETLKHGSEGSMWRAHGVTRGVRDYFYKFTQDGSGWSVNRFTAMHRPTWTAEERENKIEQYGSRDHPDYRRNVLGLHGDATNPLFVLHRLMQCVDSDETSEYNDHQYVKMRITNEDILEYGDDILPLLDFPHSHVNFKHVWIGMDVGYTNDPSEILVFSEERDNKYNKESFLKLVTRIQLERVNNPNQVAAILWLINFYKPKTFAMDKTGVGLPLFQDIQSRAKKDKNIDMFLDRIKGYNFSEKILVDFDDTVEVDEFRGDPVRDAGLYRNVLEYSSDKLRWLVDNKRLLLPWDKELIGEFQGQTYTYDKSTMDMYGRRKVFSRGSFHALDASRMAVLGWAQFSIESVTKEEKWEPPTAVLL